MVLSLNDRHLIRALREDKKMSVNKIVKEFPNRHWHKSTVARFLRRLKATGSIERRPGSGSKPTVIPPELAESVLKMIRSKDPDTGTFYSIRKIALLSGASRKMVTKIASTDLGKAPVKKKVTAQTRLKQRVAKAKRLELCSNLLRRFSNKDAVKKIWFSGERCFTLEKPKYVRIESEVTKAAPATKAAKSKKQVPAKSKKRTSTKSKKKVPKSEEEDEEEDEEETELKQKDETEKQEEKKVEGKNSSNVIKNSNADVDVLNTEVAATNSNRGIPSSTIDNKVPTIPLSEVPISNVVNNVNPSCDMSSTNNDVMNLINIYVSNPLNFVSNPNQSYAPAPTDQSCNYAMPNPSNNNYCPAPNPPPHGYGVTPNHGNHNNYVHSSYNYVGSSNPVNPTLPHHVDGNSYGQVANTNSSSKNVAVTTTNTKKVGGHTSTAVPRVSNSVIVSLAVSFGGKTEPIFIERASGFLSSDCYRREVLARVLPYIKSKTPDYVFMQDKSTAHQSQNTIKYLEENCPDFIKPEEWPPGCPQLHPIEYFVWKNLQSMVYRGEAIKTVEELKERILKCWSEISQKNIDAALSQWLNKLRAAVKKAKE